MRANEETATPALPPAPDPDENGPRSRPLGRRT